jgi:hypothetical protein
MVNTRELVFFQRFLASFFSPLPRRELLLSTVEVFSGGIPLALTR